MNIMMRPTISLTCMNSRPIICTEVHIPPHMVLDDWKYFNEFPLIEKFVDN